MKRRDVLKLGGLTLLAAGSGAYWLSGSRGPVPQAVQTLAASPAPAGKVPKTMICLFLRGGMDGMHAVVPYTEQAYYDARPKLALPRPGQPGGVHDLDGRFGLNPTLAPLLPLYQAGELAIVNAVGTECTQRSHLWCERYLETGGVASLDADGWLNRYAEKMAGDSQIPTLSTHSGIPALLLGKVPTISMTGMQDLQPRLSEQGTETAHEAILSNTDDALDRISRHTEKAKGILRSLDPARSRSTVEYPPTPLGNNFRLVAFLLKEGVDLRAVYVEQTEYDTHAGQIGGMRPLDGLFDDLSRSIAAFWQDLGALREGVMLCTLTEFGRRVKENGTLGTDHGWGATAFVLGGAVRGGKIYGEWPGLAEENLFEGIDLKVTTDYRDVFVEVAEGLGYPEGKSLFPNYEPKARLGLVGT